MKSPADYQLYRERQAINCNLLPSDYNADTREMLGFRNKAINLLKHPGLTLEQRSFAELHLAKVNRWLKCMAAHRRDTRLARLRLLREFS